MENFSKRYAEVQILLIHLEKTAVSYEEHAQQTEADSRALLNIFSKTFDAFCALIAEYLKTHHKNFSSDGSPKEIIENAHKASFLAEHDKKTLIQAVKDAGHVLTSHNELIHNLETYIQTMQTILNEIKP